MSGGSMKSDELKFTMFSRDEMDRRHDGVRALMKERGIDALFVSGEENFQYLAGASASVALHYSLTRPSVIVLPVEGDPVVITQGRDNLELGSYVSDIRDYRGLFSFPVDLAIDVIREFKCERVGVELGQEQRMGMPVGAYLEIVDRFRDVAFVDAADVLIGMRMVKSKEEILLMKSAADITGRARQKLFDLVRPGMTERDVARMMRQLILEAGGDRAAFVVLQCDQPGGKGQFKYERELERGRVLAVDSGAYVGMYAIDYPRMATLGKATKVQVETHEAVLRVSRKMGEALTPGIACSEIFRVGAEAIEEERDRESGLVSFGPARMGHGQGMLITEPPSIAPDDATVLKPGMVVSTEPGVRCGDVQFLWEDVHVITDTGAEKITLETDKLRQLAF
jgi:Xaa-Pro dipeptidase